MIRPIMAEQKVTVKLCLMSKLQCSKFASADALACKASAFKAIAMQVESVSSRFHTFDVKSATASNYRRSVVLVQCP